MKKKVSAGNRAFNAAVMAIVILMIIAVLYPLYYMLIVSISDGNAVLRGEIVLWPKGVNLNAYIAVLTNQYVPRSYLNTLLYTVSGTLIAVAMTALCAYPLSRKDFYGGKILTGIVLFTMFFDAGIISNYMVIRSIGIKNTAWAIILPGAINVWYMIIMRTFFSGIPEELFESARLDGANDLVVFWKVVLPVSKAVLATMVLFYAVGLWNQWLQPLIYLDSRDLYPMQLILRNIVLGADAALSKSMSANSDMATMGLNIKYAVIFITMLPILVVYPFVQKYFVKGVMVGSVKG
ncbi:MAG: carbohydrate ABC transporter permease [Eubacteriales bacterium]|nr:carbohydrate ABC transporter permease [Eubacteriales bacterium]